MSVVKIAPPVESLITHLINLSIRLQLNEEGTQDHPHDVPPYGTPVAHKIHVDFTTAEYIGVIRTHCIKIFVLFIAIEFIKEGDQFLDLVRVNINMGIIISRHRVGPTEFDNLNRIYLHIGARRGIAAPRWKRQNEERYKENRDPFCCHVDQSFQYLDTYPVR